MDKFDTTKPLLESIGKNYPRKCDLKYNKFEQPKEFDLYLTMKGEPIPEKPYKIVFGIKATPEEFTKYDFLWCPDGPAFVAHKRVIEKLKELCPKDFQAFPIIIKNLTNKGEPFVNKDFYLINVTHKLELINKDESIFSYSVVTPTAPIGVNKLVLRENSMGGHKLARNIELKSRIYFSADLAKVFSKSKGIQFLTDEEYNQIHYRR